MKYLNEYFTQKFLKERLMYSLFATLLIYKLNIYNLNTTQDGKEIFSIRLGYYAGA